MFTQFIHRLGVEKLLLCWLFIITITDYISIIYTYIGTIYKYMSMCENISLFDVSQSNSGIYVILNRKSSANMWTRRNASLCCSWFLFHNNMLIIRVLVLILIRFLSFVGWLFVGLTCALSLWIPLFLWMIWFTWQILLLAQSHLLTRK